MEWRESVLGVLRVVALAIWAYGVSLVFGPLIGDVFGSGFIGFVVYFGVALLMVWFSRRLVGSLRVWLVKRGYWIAESEESRAVLPLLKESVEEVEGYELLELIEEDEFFQRFLVRRRGSGRVYELKLVRSGEVESYARQLLWRELRVAKQFRSAGFVKDVCGRGVLRDGRAYLLKEAQKGERVRLLSGLGGGALLLSLVRDLVGVLRALHGRGYVLRGLTGDQVYVDGFGELSLESLGLGGFLAENRLPMRGFKGGRVAPEVLMKESKVSLSQDIYGLGVVIVELVCGVEFQGPFDGEWEVGLRGRLRSLGLEESSVRSCVSLVRGCLRDDPEERFGSLAEIEGYLS